MHGRSVSPHPTVEDAEDRAVADTVRFVFVRRGERWDRDFWFYTHEELGKFIVNNMVALILEALIKIILMEVAGYYVGKIGGASYKASAKGEVSIELRSNHKLPLRGAVVYLDVRGDK